MITNKFKNLRSLRSLGRAKHATMATFFGFPLAISRWYIGFNVG